MNYLQKLQNIILKTSSNVIIGLDSDETKFPDFFSKYKNPVSEFNKFIIESTKDIVAGYKLNMAFYEYLEETGIEAVRETLKAIPDETVKICDAKRGDIGNTSEMYAATYFDKYNFDSITASPYIGVDGIEPFLKRKNKLVYVLALTSNNGSDDFQKLKTGDKYLYEIVLEKFLNAATDNNIGFVFGAGHTDELNIFTKSHQDTPLLIPGIGAQSNDLEKLIKALHSKNFVINSSREIIYSAKKNCDEREFSESIRSSVSDLNKKINR